MKLFCRISIAALLSLGNLSLFASHTLSSSQSSVIAEWLTNNRGYRLASDQDCDCTEDINMMRAGSGGIWKPVPDYHPYVASGDFNGDGIIDFAVVVINTRKAHDSVLLVFNGPNHLRDSIPAFVGPHDDLGRSALFFGPPRPKPYRLVVGPFESDNTLILKPHGKTYRLIE
jgi:hypothetical protein